MKYLSILSILMSFFSLSNFAVAQDFAIKENEICVVNKSHEKLLFTAEAGQGTHQTKLLEVGESLCVKASENATKAVVSVFESKDEFEGCSRIIEIGTIEELFKFADADRCLWSSNQI